MRALALTVAIKTLQKMESWTTTTVERRPQPVTEGDPNSWTTPTPMSKTLIKTASRQRRLMQKLLAS